MWLIDEASTWCAPGTRVLIADLRQKISLQPTVPARPNFMYSNIVVSVMIGAVFLKSGDTGTRIIFLRLRNIWFVERKTANFYTFYLVFQFLNLKSGFFQEV